MTYKLVNANNPAINVELVHIILHHFVLSILFKHHGP